MKEKCWVFEDLQQNPRLSKKKKKSLFISFYCKNVYNKLNNNVDIYIIPISTPFSILLSQFFMVLLWLFILEVFALLSLKSTAGLQHVQEEEVDLWGWCVAQDYSSASARREKWRKFIHPDSVYGTRRRGQLASASKHYLLHLTDSPL